MVTPRLLQFAHPPQHWTQLDAVDQSGNPTRDPLADILLAFLKYPEKVFRSQMLHGTGLFYLQNWVVLGV